ncbi:hypothetical protein MACH15_27290 [Maricaulis maris]|jgi:hypothetical protein|nr:hypothetical protein MACH15_27290 [Maricaulis maris]
MSVAAQIAIILSALRGLYGLRSVLAGLLDRFGFEGQLGYSPVVTRELAATGWELASASAIIQLGYFVIAWAIWRRAPWLIWLGAAVYLADQAVWIGFSLRPEDFALHQQSRLSGGFDPDVIDWIMFTAETLIVAAVIALGLRYRPRRT